MASMPNNSGVAAASTANGGSTLEARIRHTSRYGPRYFVTMPSMEFLGDRRPGGALGDDDDDGAQRFTLFGNLPAELREAVWVLAVREKRLVHLRANNCWVRNQAVRRGCPLDGGCRLVIDGVRYEQVSAYFFVNRECRHYALQWNSIRFSVTTHFKANFAMASVVTATNIIMSPDDVLVSWYAEELHKYGKGFNVRFGQDASMVRNVMVRPWDVLPKTYQKMINMNPCAQQRFFNLSLVALSHLVKVLGNKEALEKIYLLHRHALTGPLTYGGSVEWPMGREDFDVALHYLCSPYHLRYLHGLMAHDRPGFCYLLPGYN